MPPPANRIIGRGNEGCKGATRCLPPWPFCFLGRIVIVKRLYAGFLVAAFVAFTGCNGKSTPGGPGATNTGSGKGTQFGQADNSFKLSTPILETKLKQSESKVAAISIKRGKNFD